MVQLPRSVESAVPIQQIVPEALQPLLPQLLLVLPRCGGGQTPLLPSTLLLRVVLLPIVHAWRRSWTLYMERR